MPGFLLSVGAVLTCPHGGTATIVPIPPPRVLVDRSPPATAVHQIAVAGCTFLPPCATVRWLNVSARVLVGGEPVLLQAPPPVPPPVPGNATCAPTPAPPLLLSSQLRVTGS